MKKNKGNKNKLITSVALFSFAMVMALIGSVMMENNNSTKFNQDVLINGSSVKGYTVEKANQVISNKLKEDVQNATIKLMYQDKVWEITNENFDAEATAKVVVQRAFDSVKNGEKGKFVSAQNASFNTALSDVFTNFNEKLNNIIQEVEIEPVNASVTFEPNNEKMFTINEAVNGVKVNKEDLIKNIENQFLKTKDINVFIPTSTEEPEISSEYFNDKLSLQGKFSTSIKNSQEGRRHNVTHALAKLNGTVVKPGEIVSFNQISGPQNASGGYKNAIVILNGVFTEGMGGGICQASSTCYNACVLANLEILEVHKHTLPVTYVELSLDAMVSDGYADLQFRNPSEDDIYFKSYVNGDDAVVEIYGKTIPENTTIKRVAEFIGNIPHNGDKIVPDKKGEYLDKVLYKGEYYRLKYPREGYEAKAFKEMYKDGELISREEIRHEKYQPVDGIIIEGVQDLPESFVLPKQDIEFIKPQEASKKLAVIS